MKLAEQILNTVCDIQLQIASNLYEPAVLGSFTVWSSGDFVRFYIHVVCVFAISQVKKIFENEKRLQAGDHSLDLLAHDFEKNYNMYVYPVHWQFGQLDQHPVDGYVWGNENKMDRMLMKGLNGVFLFTIKDSFSFHGYLILMKKRSYIGHDSGYNLTWQNERMKISVLLRQWLSFWQTDSWLASSVDDETSDLTPQQLQTETDGSNRSSCCLLQNHSNWKNDDVASRH